MTIPTLTIELDFLPANKLATSSILFTTATTIMSKVKNARTAKVSFTVVSRQTC